MMRLFAYSLALNLKFIEIWLCILPFYSESEQIKATLQKGLQFPRRDSREFEYDK